MTDFCVFWMMNLRITCCITVHWRSAILLVTSLLVYPLRWRRPSNLSAVWYKDKNCTALSNTDKDFQLGHISLSFIRCCYTITTDNVVLVCILSVVCHLESYSLAESSLKQFFLFLWSVSSWQFAAEEVTVLQNYLW